MVVVEILMELVVELLIGLVVELLVGPVEVVLTILVVLLETGPPGPFTLDSPLRCKVVGNNGWISFCHTVVYSPGLPSAATLPGSRLPHCCESEQHGL
jgi:hypothetical protein